MKIIIIELNKNKKEIKMTRKIKNKRKTYQQNEHTIQKNKKNLLHLTNEQLYTLSSKLITSDIEIGGYIHINKERPVYHTNTKNIKHVISTVNKIEEETSNSDADIDSVQIDNFDINYHLHPLSVYVENDCIFGQPSSEDLIQCITYAMEGENRCHIVVTLEGIYLIKICFVFMDFFRKIKSNKKKETFKECLFDYFKQLHVLRRKDIAPCAKYSPKRYINIINNFKIHKIPKCHELCYDNESLLKCNPFHIYFYPSNLYLKWIHTWNGSYTSLKTILYNQNYRKELEKLVTTYDKNKTGFYIDIS